MNTRLPPLAKNPCTDQGSADCAGASRSPYQRWNSGIEVISIGSAGPRSVSPTKPAVLVPTPWIGTTALRTSST
jgi:hypothetical protein